MNNKAKKLYAIFDKSIINNVSGNKYIDAIKGFDVFDAGQVFTARDVAAKVLRNNMFNSLSENDIAAFSNPLSGQTWYVSNYFIAYGSTPTEAPRILLVKIDTIFLVNNVSTIALLSKALDRAHQIVVENYLGFLSWPSKTHVNNCSYSYEVNTVKLPVVL